MRTIVIGILILICTQLSSQTDVAGNYFNYSRASYNPAAAGMNDVFTVSLNYQKQWMGFDGAPVSSSLALHTPSRKQRIAFGLVASSYRIGNQKYITTDVLYAYRINFNQSVISFGLQAGLRTYGEDDLYLTNSSDPVFEETTSYMSPNFGIGFMFALKGYHLGFSIPDLLHYNYDEKKLKHDINYYDYYLTTGYDVRLMPILKMHPAVLLKYNKLVGSQLNLNLLNVTALDKYMLGMNYIIRKQEDRKLNSLGVLAMLQLNPQTDLGMSYEMNGGEIAEFSAGSLEVFLQYKFSYKLNVSSPRTF